MEYSIKKHIQHGELQGIHPHLNDTIRTTSRPLRLKIRNICGNVCVYVIGE